MELFSAAKPVFVPGLSGQKNTLGAFRTDFHANPGSHTELIIAAHTFYRIYLNGRWVGTGPVPAAYGYLKADRYDLSSLLNSQGEANQLAIEVMGYVPEENFASGGPSCLLAEVISEGQIICATGKEWQCRVLTQKDCFTETLSFGRRVPLEAYHLNESYTTWRTGTISDSLPCEELTTEYIITERDVRMPDTSIDRNLVLTGLYSQEQTTCHCKEKGWWETDEYISRCGGDKISRPSLECLCLSDCSFEGTLKESEDTAGIRHYHITDYEKPAALEFTLTASETGFIGIGFWSEEPVTVDITWNDYLDDEGKIPVRVDSVNRVIRLTTQGGSFRFESMEPHYVKYIRVIVRGGRRFSFQDLYLRTYRYEDTRSASFLCSDTALNRIYHSARRTLLTNTLGFFLDSPERERGGWAGDSYWTGRAAAMLLSDTSVERSMLYDFLHSGYSLMMEGSFSSCCTAGQKNETEMMYSWNLFVLLELTDYYQRTGDEKMKSAYQDRVALFIEASKQFKNDAGVLENVPGSMFIDWSLSNNPSYKTPISTVANCLYAMVLHRLADMYENDRYRREAEQIRCIFRRVYDKVKTTKNDLFTLYPFMADSMSLKDGELIGNGFYSEAAQYYYFWTGLLTPKTAPQLWKILKEQYGPAPQKYRGTAHLRVGNCGVFFGHTMRMDLLGQFHETELLETEMKKFCGYMVNQEPGTFWETMNGEDSRSHGFGSHYGVQLIRDFLGIDMPDRLTHRILFAPRPGTLQWAKGTFSNEDGRIAASWNKDQAGFKMHISVPSDYTVEIILPREYRVVQQILVNGKYQSAASPILLKDKADIYIEQPDD